MLRRMSCGFSRSQSSIPRMPRSNRSLISIRSSAIRLHSCELAPAVQAQDGAGDEIGATDEEEQCVHRLFDRSPAAGGDALEDLLRIARLALRRQDGAERQAVHPDGGGERDSER